LATRYFYRNYGKTNINQVNNFQLICNKRFISKCTNSKANRKTTILTTQDLDQALACCIKMVQQISYAQDMRNLKENNRLQPAILSRDCTTSLIRKFFSDWEEDYSNPRFLIKQSIR